MSLTTIIYILIALLVFVCDLYNLVFKETRVVDKIGSAMILIPLILRILMIK